MLARGGGQGGGVSCIDRQLSRLNNATFSNVFKCFPKSLYAFYIRIHEPRRVDERRLCCLYVHETASSSRSLDTFAAVVQIRIDCSLNYHAESFGPYSLYKKRTRSWPTGAHLAVSSACHLTRIAISAHSLRQQ